MQQDRGTCALCHESRSSKRYREMLKNHQSSAAGWKVREICTLPETNSEFTPENGWLEYDCFLLGPGLLLLVSGSVFGTFLEKELS